MVPELSLDFIKETLKDITSPYKKQLRIDDFKRFQFYSGNIIPVLQEAFAKEFQKPETITELGHRMVPLNIVKKIVNKLAGLYIETPVREATNKDEDDQLLIDNLSWFMSFNQRQKEANRYFKLYKRNLQEVYIDKNGFPQVKNLPRHTYEVYSHDPLSPAIPDVVVKILNEVGEPEDHSYAFYTANQHVVVNGKGETDTELMNSMNNPDGVNPYGVLPFIYINESSFMVSPLPNDDLLRNSILVCTLLSDLAFASKYKTFNINYIIGYDGELPSNPNSIVSLPRNPDGSEPKIGSISPEFDMQQQLTLIQEITSTLLSTNNLSANALKANIDAFGPQSGIAKALDESQSIEDKKDQQEYFIKAEEQFWTLMKENFMPYWQKTNMLNDAIKREFSSDFDIMIQLREPKVQITVEEQIKISNDRIQSGFSTHARELQFLYPELDTEELEELENEILEEQVRRRQMRMELLAETTQNVDETIVVDEE
jgi:hypothetical protein